MISTTSSNNMPVHRTPAGFAAIYRWSLRKRMGMSILYGVLAFMAMPMVLLLLFSYENFQGLSSSRADGRMASVLDVVFPALIVPLTMLFTLLICCMMFSYMQNKRSVDLFYSLPVKRSGMFLGRYLGGLTLILVPYVLTCLLTTLIAYINGVFLPVAFAKFVPNVFWLALCVVAAYTFSAAVFICSGTTVDAVISIIFVSLAYPAAVYLLASLIASMLPGFNIFSAVTPVGITALSPYGAIIVPFVTTPEWTFPAYWLVFAAAAFAACFKLYTRRKSETAEITVAFSAPTIVIRLMATLSAAIGVGYLFTQMIRESHVAFWFGALIGSFAANLVLEYIYSRNFKSLKKSLAYYGGMLLFLLVFYAVIAGGCFGYSSRVPTADTVESVQVSGSCLRYFSNNGVENDTVTLTEADSIESVVQFHKSLAENILKNRTRYPSISGLESRSAISFTYRLKNGRCMTRSFCSSDWAFYNAKDSELGELLNKIMNSTEFKEKSYPVFTEDASSLISISVTHNKVFGNFSPTESQKAALMEALRADILADQQEDRSDDTEVATIHLDFQKASKNKPNVISKILQSYKVYSNYTNTLRVLKEFKWMPSEDTQSTESAPAQSEAAASTSPVGYFVGVKMGDTLTYHPSLQISVHFIGSKAD